MIIANSAYSAKFFEERWGNLQNVSVIYPPVLTMAQKPCIPQKEKIIVAVGRFFVGGHSKKQDELVCFFRRHIDLFEGYEFHLIGGLSPSNKEASKYVNKIRKLAAGFPVYLHINASHEEVLSFYKRAQIFWHATGYKEDFLRNPDRMEHFGITTVEAMHYGAIPIVINAGGQPEIVGHGKNGFLWNTEEECIHYTHEIITNKALAQSIAYNAFERSNWFSIEKFHERNTILFNAYHEGNTHD
jgi:glycosyltransferase involved in cell wall biosynthesis